MAETKNNIALWKKVLAHFSVLYGYTLPNAAFYTQGGLYSFELLIEILHGVITDDSPAYIKDFFKDETHITAFVVVLTAIFLLSTSNQKRYGDMALELWGKPANKEAKHNLKTWFEGFADIIGTHTKVIVTSGAFKQMLDKVIAPEYSLAIALCMVPFGELAQFAVLGREHGFSTFLNAFSSFFESTAAAAVIFAVTHALLPDSAPFATLLSWSALLLFEAGIVSATHKSITHLFISKIIACCKQLRDEEKQPLLVESSSKSKSWWQTCCFWSSPSINQSENPSILEQGLFSPPSPQ